MWPPQSNFKSKSAKTQPKQQIKQPTQPIKPAKKQQTTKLKPPESEWGSQ